LVIFFHLSNAKYQLQIPFWCSWLKQIFCLQKCIIYFKSGN
jgi:hypothetical protein